MRRVGLYLMAILYVGAGINHFIVPDFYAKTITSFLPYATELVYVSGVIEIGLGLALFFPKTRVFAAWGVIALLLAVFPANIYMALHPEMWHLPALGLWLRLPIQFVLMYWAWIYTRPSFSGR